MSLLRMWSYLQGYVVIMVEGKQIEKFINMAVAKGYNLWDIYQPRDNLMLAKVDLEVYPALRHVARACRCRMRIRDKRGLPFMAVKIRRRRMLAVGAFLFFVSLYILSSFIWSVEVISNRELHLISKEQVLEAVSDLGLRRGTFRLVLDTKEIEKSLEKKFPEISWVGVEVRGAKAIVSVVEKILPGEEKAKGPGNIVAAKDGLIKEILVLSGEPKVAAGDTVKKGEILISGVIYPQPSPLEQQQPEEQKDPAQEEPSQLEPLYLKAKGIVRARIWYEARVQVPLIEEKEVFTGKTQQVVALELMGKRVVLKNETREKLNNYRKQDRAQDLTIWKYRLPLRLVTTTLKEVEKKEFYYSMAEAKALAEKKALKDISSQLPQDSQIVSQRTEVSSANERELKAVIYVETVESIGEFSPLG